MAKAQNAVASSKSTAKRLAAAQKSDKAYIEKLAAKKASRKKAPATKKLTFAKGDVVSHTKHATGVIEGPTNTPGVFKVKFDLMKGPALEIPQAELQLELAAKKKKSPTAQKRHKLAVNDRVEHPVRGLGTVTKLELPVGNILVRFDTVNPEYPRSKVSGVTSDEVKFVMSDRDYKKQQAKTQANATSKTEFGSAIEQNRAYAKLAAKIPEGTPVVEINGLKRVGTVAEKARKGSGYLEVKFATGVQTKFVGDIKVVSKSVPEQKAQWEIGAWVLHPVKGAGTVMSHTKTSGIVSVLFGDAEVHTETVGCELSRAGIQPIPVGTEVEHPTFGIGKVVKAAKGDVTLYGTANVLFESRADKLPFVVNLDMICLVDEGAPELPVDEWVVGTRVEHPTHGKGTVSISAEGTPAGITTVHFDEGNQVAAEVPDSELSFASEEVALEKQKKVRFEEIGLFEAFIHNDRTHVKVGNTSAIRVVVDGIPCEPFAMLATPENQMAKDAKARFRLKDKVVRYVGTAVTVQ